MKLKTLLALLVAAAFLFTVSCKEKAKEPAEKGEAKAKTEVAEKTEGSEKKEAVEKKEAKEENEENEGKEEAGEKGEKAEAKPVDLKILPEAVLNAFKAAYPKAEIKGASKEVENGATQYEVESVDGELNRDLLYTPEGKVIEFEETIAPEALPEPVKATLAKDYPGAKVLKAEILTKDGTKNFELSIQDKDKKFGVTIDPAGKVIEKEPAEKPANPSVKK